ncbi:MAG: SIMPL domain-containing protein [Deltaproteobacteria bacterium]|nr:SIMPL domain-containing protein [Deltaproteobacteria bacterium]
MKQFYRLAMFMALTFIVIIHAGISLAHDQATRTPSLTVRGKALLLVPADQVRLRVGVVTNGDTADAALAKNTEKMRKVEQAIITTGLTKEEYQTGRFQIRPDWEPRPRNVGRDWKPRIVGYTVTNTLDIKTGKIELTGKLIGACTAAGANDVGSIIFDLADPRIYRAKAIAQAVAHAKADAEIMAKAAAVGLVKVLSLHLDDAVEQPRRVNRPQYARSAMAEADSAPDITPGEVTVRASVMMVFEISEGASGAK